MGGYLEKCVELGVKNIHVHKGPTIWPLDKDSFDVSDVDYVATNFTDLNFIVEHVGMPRIEDFCWIVQEPNVGGLAVLIPSSTPAEVLRRRDGGAVSGSARTACSSRPTTPSGTRGSSRSSSTSTSRAGQHDDGVSLSVEAKQKIHLNACKLYDIDPVEHGAKLRADEFGQPRRGPPRRRRRARPQAEGALAEEVTT